MRYTLTLALLLAASPASAYVLIVPGTASSTARPSQITSGVSGESLADTPVTDTIPHKPGEPIFLSLDVTAGTTTSFTVACEESANASVWTWIGSCDNANPATCGRHVLTFAITSYVDHSVKIESAMPYVRCTLDDAIDGTGTVSVYGVLP